MNIHFDHVLCGLLLVIYRVKLPTISWYDINFNFQLKHMSIRGLMRRLVYRNRCHMVAKFGVFVDEDHSNF